jgi:nucleotide-binding universal stress UspA family protein
MSSDPIVAGTDGSANAELAVDRAGELADSLDAGVYVVSAYPSISVGGSMAASGGVAIADTSVEPALTAQKLVARTRERLEVRGISVKTHVCAGNAAEALTTIAEDEHAQMIVVGNRGMTGARRILGSVPNRVSHHAGCDVLIAATDMRSHPLGAPLPGASIVVGTDGSAGATRAVDEAVRLGKALGSEVHIVSSYKPLKAARIQGAPADLAQMQPPQPDSLVEASLDVAATAARVAGVSATTHASKQDPVDALLDVAAKTEAALIVVGSKGMHGTSRLSLGNVPNQMSHRGPCNVLIAFTGG